MSPLTEQTIDDVTSSWFLVVNQETAAMYLQLCEGYASEGGEWHEPDEDYCKWSVMAMTTQGQLNLRSYLISMLMTITQAYGAIDHYDRILDELKLIYDNAQERNTK